jgi:hypothetical protein
MRRTFATLGVLMLYLLHQDIWFWRDVRPIVLGFLPIGLSYHVGYTIISAVVLAALVRWCWPSHLENTKAPE